jgi:hypothetical protein
MVMSRTELVGLVRHQTAVVRFRKQHEQERLSQTQQSRDHDDQHRVLAGLALKSSVSQLRSMKYALVDLEMEMDEVDCTGTHSAEATTVPTNLSNNVSQNTAPTATAVATAVVTTATRATATAVATAVATVPKVL